MPVTKDGFDGETLDLMRGAFEAAWEEVGFALASKDADPAVIRGRMALAIIKAVLGGEHDPEILKELALRVVAEAH